MVQFSHQMTDKVEDEVFKKLDSSYACNSIALHSLDCPLQNVS